MSLYGKGFSSSIYIIEDISSHWNVSMFLEFNSRVVCYFSSTDGSCTVDLYSLSRDTKTCAQPHGYLYIVRPVYRCKFNTNVNTPRVCLFQASLFPSLSSLGSRTSDETPSRAFPKGIPQRGQQYATLGSAVAQSRRPPRDVSASRQTRLFSLARRFCFFFILQLRRHVRHSASSLSHCFSYPLYLVY